MRCGPLGKQSVVCGATTTLTKSNLHIVLCVRWHNYVCTHLVNGMNYFIPVCKHSLETDVHFSILNHFEYCIQGLYIQWCHLYDMLMCGSLRCSFFTHSTQFPIVKLHSFVQSPNTLFPINPHLIGEFYLLVLFQSLHWQFWQAKINIPHIYSGKNTTK